MKHYQILLISLFFWAPTLANSAHAVPLKFVFHDFAPFSYQDENEKPVGILVELAQRFCQEWLEPCSVSVLPNRRAKHLFAAGEVQGIFLGWNPERATSMWFSIPMVETEYGFYSLNKLSFNSLTQLSGRTVGVYGPSNTYTSLMLQQQKLAQLNYEKFTTAIYPQGDELPLKMLSKRRFSAYYVNKEVGRYYAEKLGLNNLNYLSTHKHIYYCVAFNMEHTSAETVKTFNHEFQRLLNQGKLADIYQKWQMEPAYLDPIMYPEMNMPY
ncbi:hypothetical protein TUM4644_20030 [Shewanella colwelliana]|uniref:substrate-binding periplasmic protein n=1 Tax=Shewanella colwelliana TaxID=23 RepID=UPI001BBF786F|nr:transporter substrate-binding domain-containing protein [Shewanella colwelliana]GIU25053.1 hypothetical protein TUM4644_20030 [Shewanella colwelliana]